MAKKSKLYKAQAALVDRSTRYSLADAVKLLQSLPKVKFDQTVELSFKLGVDPKQTDQTVRGAVPLPPVGRGSAKKDRNGGEHAGR